MELMKASNQWATRPADERYKSLPDLHEAVMQYYDQAREARGVAFSALRVEAQDREVVLVGKANVPSKLTHFAFGQVAQRIGAPASYLRALPPTLAAQNLNHGLAKDTGEKTNILLHQNGGYVVRGFASDDYTRIWNKDITSRLLKLTEESPEWQPAPAAFDGSRGLYASAQDIFCFLVDNDRRIFEKDPNGGLGRGFFVENMELPGKAAKITTFYYQYVCGNHIVWQASGVAELAIRHVGVADERFFGKLQVELKRYADGSAEGDEARITKARTMELGDSKDAVLDAVFKLGIQGLSRGLISDGYDKAVEHEGWYGSPRSVFGLASGLTEIARDLPFADKRVELDRAAGRVMSVAF